MTTKELVYELPKGLVKWYEFKKDKNALFLKADTELDSALAEALTEKGLKTECQRIMDTIKIEAGKYDYIVLADALVYGKEHEIEYILKMARKGLKKEGRLFLCADNRLGIRYFCGDQDPFTDRNFDGIENYRRISDKDKEELRGKLYAKAELKNMLDRAGFVKQKFYSVFPGISCPQILFAEGYTPVEELKIRVFPHYHNPDTVFLEEENLYTSLIQNGLFHSMANGFLVECPLESEFTDANQITISINRGREDALCTIIRKNGVVEKIPAYEEGKAKIERLLENNRYLQKCGVNMIEGKKKGDSFLMPYVAGTPLIKYFRSLAETDKEKFFCKFDKLWQLILSSSQHVPYEEVDWEHFNPWWDEEKEEKVRNRIDRKKWRRVAFGTEKERENLGTVLKRGYLDLVLLNGFMINNEFVFYDQELFIENLPAKAIMLRNIDFLYHGDVQMQKLLPREELLKRYGMEEYQEIFYAHIGHFLTKLRNDDILREYYEKHRRNDEVIHGNRQRMNYSASEYQRLFVDIFKNVDNKKIFLFGSGNFTKKFLALYKEDYEITGILDNDTLKCGIMMEGIPILLPSVLQELDASTYKVIICIKNYTGVLRQVKKLGATNIGVYDTNTEYPRKQKVAAISSIQGEEKKKYHVGYVAGVFDLFHIGHLNLLKRAKEQCDYLIVGVVTDEGVRVHKHTDSFICFEERIEIVRACKYVDEAVGIPLKFYDTKDAYLKFQFDVQFSGSDYSEDAGWKKKQEYLRSHGAELVFFPYTESTSSTRIKEMIDRRLM